MSEAIEHVRNNENKERSEICDLTTLCWVAAWCGGWSLSLKYYLSHSEL